jgi:hypothetical protein
MTRTEFTEQLWAEDSQLPMKLATNLWWWNPNLHDSLQLTFAGCKQIVSSPRFSPRMRRWSQHHVENSRAYLQLIKLRCPWAVEVFGNAHSGNYIGALWLYGETENMWMTMCDGDMSRFLTTWVVDDK